MGKLFLIGLAGFVGTLGRYGLSGVVAKRYGETFPLGTLAVNLIGCFLVGLLFYLMQERLPRKSERANNNPDRVVSRVHCVLIPWVADLYSAARW